jgi:hypothetical protein
MGKRTSLKLPMVARRATGSKTTPGYPRSKLLHSFPLGKLARNCRIRGQIICRSPSSEREPLGATMEGNFLGQAMT